MPFQFPSIYSTTLAELVQNHELVCKLRASFSEGDEIQTDEENAFETVDAMSNGSEVSESVSAEELVDEMKKFSNES